MLPLLVSSDDAGVEIPPSSKTPRVFPLCTDRVALPLDSDTPPLLVDAVSVPTMVPPTASEIEPFDVSTATGPSASSESTTDTLPLLVSTMALRTPVSVTRPFEVLTRIAPAGPST